MNDAIQHNTRKYTERRVSNPDYVANYFTKKRLKFYADVVRIANEKGVEYDDHFIADMGCSTGHLLMHVQSHYTPFYLAGYDFCEAALDIGKRKSFTISFNEHDIYDPVDRNYDVIFCTQTLEHLEWPEIALDNILAMMAKKSKAVITVPDGDQDGLFGTLHVHKWNIDEWREFVEKTCDQHDNNFEVDVHLFEDALFTIITRV